LGKDSLDSRIVGMRQEEIVVDHAVELGPLAMELLANLPDCRF
jgi:hypothetical protein